MKQVKIKVTIRSRLDKCGVKKKTNNLERGGVVEREREREFCMK